MQELRAILLCMAAISTKPVLRAKAAATVSPKSHKGFAHSAWAFLSDFAGISGARGRLAVLYALGAALLDGISVSFLIPLLGVLFGSSAIPRWLGAITPLGGLALLGGWLALLFERRSG